MTKFKEQLPKVSHEEFQAFIMEVCLVARTSMQSVLDIADTTTRVMVLAVTTRRTF